MGRRCQALERLGYDAALTCGFTGVKIEDGYNLSTTPKYSSELGYKWMLQEVGYQEALRMWYCWNR